MGPDGTVLGEIARMEGPGQTGDGIDNLLLLCPRHVEGPDMAKLREWKALHEKRHEGQPYEIPPASLRQALEQAGVRDRRASLRKTGSRSHLTPVPASQDGPIGRESDLEALHEKLLSERSALLLSEMRGVGRTTLARAYAMRYGDEFDHVGWIDCLGSLRESLLTQMRERLPVDGPVEGAYARLLSDLEGLPGRKLLVFDNLVREEDAAELREILGSFHKLVTSRTSHGFPSLAVGRLSGEDAGKLFRKHCRVPVDDSYLSALLAEADGHTLLVEMLAKVHARIPGGGLPESLRSKDIGSAEFRRRIRMRPAGPERALLEHLATLFELSQFSQEERLLLKRLSVLPSLDYPPELCDVLGYGRAKFEELALGLWERGWLLRSDAGLRCHGVVRDFFALCDPATFADCRDLAGNLARNLHEKSHAGVLERAAWIPLAECVLESLDEEEEGLAVLCNNLATIHRTLGNLRQALLYAERTQTIADKILEPKDPRLATVCGNLATICRDLGERGRATDFLRKAIALLEQSFPPGHRQTGIAREDLKALMEEG